ncbi:MAG: hypothetical protein AABW82_01725 [Nanoarchaeota archaeon]
MVRPNKEEANKKRTNIPKYHHRGILGGIEGSEDNSLLLRTYGFHNLTFHKERISRYGRLVFSGNELLIPAMINETCVDGNVLPLELEMGRREVKSLATVCRLTDEVIIAIPHTIRGYENFELILGEKDKFEVYHPREIGGIGKLVEKFLYRAGGTNNRHFTNAKTQILSALGIQNAESIGNQYSLSVEEAFRYNLNLERDEYESPNIKPERVSTCPNLLS